MPGGRGAPTARSAGAFRAAGLIPLGRTNVPELALMGTTEPDAYGPTHNPWNLGRSPGGSSGGSAVAVAAGLVPAAHATDIAGSIRIPASQCGLVGLKPTAGGVVPGRAADYAVGMNTDGVLTRSMRDTAALLDAITERVPNGPWPAPPLPGALIADVGKDPGRLRIGLCVRRSMASTSTTDVRRRPPTRRRLLEQLGHEVAEDVPATLFEPDLLAGSAPCSRRNAAAELDGWSARLGRPRRGRCRAADVGEWCSKGGEVNGAGRSPCSTASTRSSGRAAASVEGPGAGRVRHPGHANHR